MPTKSPSETSSTNLRHTFHHSLPTSPKDAHGPRSDGKWNLTCFHCLNLNTRKTYLDPVRSVSYVQYTFLRLSTSTSPLQRHFRRCCIAVSPIKRGKAVRLTSQDRGRNVALVLGAWYCQPWHSPSQRGLGEGLTSRRRRRAIRIWVFPLL